MRNFILIAILLFCTLFYLKNTTILTSKAMKEKPPCLIIDVGHGGIDPGKVSTDGILEKNVNLQIALHLKKEFQNKNFKIYLTRETDCGLYDENASHKKISDLNNRIQFFHEKKADYVISIHQNSYSDAESHGAQTFYHTDSEEGNVMANTIQKSLLEIDPSNHRNATASNRYYLLKKTSIPSIIIECGFLSNPEETAKLTNPDYQQKLAHAIYLGFCNYIQKKGAAFY